MANPILSNFTILRKANIFG